MSRLPNPFRRASATDGSDPVLPLHNIESQRTPQDDSSAALGSVGTSSSSTRPPALRSRSINALQGQRGPAGDVEASQTDRRRVSVTEPPPTAPAAIGASPGRRRAHTVSVSLASAKRQNFDTTRSAGRGSANANVEQGLDDEELGIRRRRSSSVARRRASTATPVSFELEEGGEDLDDHVVGMLDVIDPHVSTVNDLQNMTNSLLIPHLPQLWSRRPEVVLPEAPKSAPEPTGEFAEQQAALVSSARQRSGSRARSATVSSLFPPTSAAPTSARTTEKPISPPIIEESSEEEEEAESLSEDIAEIEKEHELDAHVKHVLLSKSQKQKLKGVAKGVWTFVKTPMGMITAVYGFLVAFWGAAIVLFLLGWIPTSSKYRQDVWVEISSQVENGLFTLTGVGLIPWRVIDTYRMFIIWKLQRLTKKLRAERGLPPIDDPNDLPDPRDAQDYVSVLSEKQQAQLRHQQEQFAKSQTWYRPHATATHTAFPISWALGNTLLMDGNSMFQCMLCGCMWGLNWHIRPAWTTGTLIPLSFLCGIGAGVLIWRGSVRTKKRDTVESKLREALGVPLAIGMPAAKDGPNTSSPVAANDSDTVISSDAVEKSQKARRTTVTLGEVRDPPMGANVGGNGEVGRVRAATVAAPERGSKAKATSD